MMDALEQRGRPMTTRVGRTVGMLWVLSLILWGAVSNAEEGTIAIGAGLGMSGPSSIAKASIPLDIALRDCFAIANESGGVNGKKIQYFMKDDRYQPRVGIEVFKELMAEHGPLCVFGSGTPVALAVAPLLRKQFPVLYSSTSFSAKLAYSGIPSLFVSGPTYGDQVAIALKYIARVKSRARVVFFYSKSPLGEDPIPYGRVVCRRLRLPLVGEVAGDFLGGDHTAQIETIKRMKPDYVIMHGWVGPANAALIQQFRDRGVDSEIIVTIWGAMKSVVDRLGPNAQSFLCVNPYAYWWMEDIPMIQTIRAYTAAHYPDTSYRPLTYMVAFTAGMIFVESLRRADVAGDLSRAGLIKALHSIKNFNTRGLTPPLRIKNNRFPIARILRSKPREGIFQPASGWIRFY
jgi:branched-chain amino acid transport system substrate-binding protein